MTIDELEHLKESEDKVEFKAAEHNYPFAGGSHTSQEERRKCFLGYIVAYCGLRLVLLINSLRFGTASFAFNCLIESVWAELESSYNTALSSWE